MADPFTSSGFAYATVGGVAFLGLFAGQDPGVLTAALSGALIFTISAKEWSPLGRICLFWVSMVAGVVAAPFVASMISAFTPDGVNAPNSLGALISSAIAVRLLMAASINPTAFLGRFRSGGGDGNSK